MRQGGGYVFSPKALLCNRLSVHFCSLHADSGLSALSILTIVVRIQRRRMVLVLRSHFEAKTQYRSALDGNVGITRASKSYAVRPAHPKTSHAPSLRSGRDSDLLGRNDPRF